MDAEVLSDNAAKRLEILEQRRKLAIDHNVPFRKLGVTTFRTYINSIGSVFNKSGGTPKIVMSSKTQFPLFDAFTAKCATRHLDNEAAAAANKAPKCNVLQDDDLQKLFEKTNFTRAYEAQRYNLIIFGYRTGLRGDSLMKFQDTSLSIEEVDGAEIMKFHLGTMKNMQGTLQNVSKEPWVESILPCPDKKFCALEAYKRQCALLETKGNVPLFRSVKCYDVNLGPQRGTTELCAGAATWASKVLGRKMVFKDLARRAAMTKVANSALPLSETSKYFHVKVDTMMGYHKVSEGTVPKVASILSAYPCAPKPTTSPPTTASSVVVLLTLMWKRWKNRQRRPPFPMLTWKRCKTRRRG